MREGGRRRENRGGEGKEGGRRRENRREGGGREEKRE